MGTPSGIMGSQTSVACCDKQPISTDQTIDLDRELTGEAIEDTEKVEAFAEEKRKQEEEEAERLRVEEERAAKQKEEEEQERLRLAEEAERRAELERKEAEEAKRRGDEEEALKHKLAAEAAEREAKEVAEKAEKADRAKQVQEWIKTNHFASHNEKKAAKCCGGASHYPIHAAAQDGRVDIVRGLLEANADPTQKKFQEPDCIAACGAEETCGSGHIAASRYSKVIAQGLREANMSPKRVNGMNCV